MTNADLARRYPWSKYPKTRAPQYATSAESLAWAKENSPFSVSWTVPDNGHGLYGWSSRTVNFKTEAEAMAAAEESMGVAFDVTAYRWNWDLPVSHAERRVVLYTRKNRAHEKKRAQARAAKGGAA